MARLLKEKLRENSEYFVPLDIFRKVVLCGALAAVGKGFYEFTAVDQMMITSNVLIWDGIILALTMADMGLEIPWKDFLWERGRILQAIDEGYAWDDEMTDLTDGK